MFVYILNRYEKHGCTQLIDIYKCRYSAMIGLKNFINNTYEGRLHYWLYDNEYNEWIGYYFDDCFGWEPQLFLDIHKVEVK